MNTRFFLVLFVGSFLLATAFAFPVYPDGIQKRFMDPSKISGWFDDQTPNSVFDIQTDKNVITSNGHNVVYVKVTNLTHSNQDFNLGLFFDKEVTVNSFGNWSMVSHKVIDYNILPDQNVSIGGVRSESFLDWNISKSQPWKKEKPTLVKKDFSAKGSLNDNVIGPNQTKYFVLDFSTEFNSSGEFLVCANSDCLDPWWNATYTYRYPINISTTTQVTSNNTLFFSTEGSNLLNCAGDNNKFEVVWQNGGSTTPIDSFVVGGSCGTAGDFNLAFHSKFNIPASTNFNSSDSNGYFVYTTSNVIANPDRNEANVYNEYDGFENGFLSSFWVTDGGAPIATNADALVGVYSSKNNSAAAAVTHHNYSSSGNNTSEIGWKVTATNPAAANEIVVSNGAANLVEMGFVNSGEFNYYNGGWQTITGITPSANTYYRFNIFYVDGNANALYRIYNSSYGLLKQFQAGVSLGGSQATTYLQYGANNITGNIDEYKIWAAVFPNPPVIALGPGESFGTSPDVNWFYPNVGGVFNRLVTSDINLVWTINDIDSNWFLVDLNYSSSSMEGTGTVLLNDINSSTVCSPLPMPLTCSFDFNILPVIDGNYWFLIRATDDKNLTDFNSSALSISIRDVGPPTVDFNWTPTAGTIDTNVLFHPIITSPNDVNVLKWMFDSDGNVNYFGAVDITKDENHAFASTSQRTVCLMVGNQDANVTTCHTLDVFGDIVLHFFDENTGLSIHPSTVTVNGIAQSLDINTLNYPLSSLVGTANITIKASDTNYAERTFFFPDVNSVYHTDINVLLLDTNKGQKINFTFFKPDQTTLLSNSLIYLKRGNTNDFSEINQTDSLGHVSFFVNQDANYTVAIDNLSDGNIDYNYSSVILTVLIPKDESSLLNITPFRIQIFGLAIYDINNLSSNQSIPLFTNTSDFYTIKISEANPGSYFARDYSYRVFGNPVTDSLQPYLVSDGELSSTINVVSVPDSVPIENVVVSSYTDVANVRTLVESKLTDGAGNALFSFIVGKDYFLFFDTNGTPSQSIWNTRINATASVYYASLFIADYNFSDYNAVRIDSNYLQKYLTYSNGGFDLNGTVYSNQPAIIAVTWNVYNDSNLLWTETRNTGLGVSNDFNAHIPYADVNRFQKIRSEFVVTFRVNGVTYTSTLDPYFTWNLQSLQANAQTIKDELGSVLVSFLAIVAALMVHGFAANNFQTFEYNGLVILFAAVLGFFVAIGWIPLLNFGIACLLGIGTYMWRVR